MKKAAHFVRRPLHGLSNVISSRPKLAFFSLALVGLLAKIWYSHSVWRGARIVFFNVGQGDSALIQLGHFSSRFSALIDIGGKIGRHRSLYRAHLQREMARYGVISVSRAILSHPDSDHGAGFTDLAQDAAPDLFLYFAKEPYRPLLQQILQHVPPSHAHLVSSVEHEHVFQNHLWYIPTSSLTPKRASHKHNDEALLVRLDVGQCSVLFLGDIERDIEEALSESKWVHHVQVVKVVHHGSNSSSTEALARAIPGALGIVSVGKRNPYHHPRKEALERLRRENWHLLRTDFHGFVELTLYNNQIHCRHFWGDCGTLSCDHASP